MKLKDVLIEFDSALYGEVADRTREWYVRVDQDGNFRGMLGSLVNEFGNVDVREITIRDLRRWRNNIFS